MRAIRLVGGLACLLAVAVLADAKDKTEMKSAEKPSEAIVGNVKTGNPTIIVRSSFWPDKAKDGILKQACAAVGGVFVDISGLSKDESNYARSERNYAHGGVARHPGDKGMQAIADALLTEMKNTKSVRQPNTTVLPH